ncbi:MAG: YbbR-like domain-containing protein [Polyangiaceae bacterium]
MTRDVLAAVLLWLRGAFTQNLGLKALSLAFALGLFVYQKGQQDQQQRTVAVGVVMRLPSESAKRELMTPIPASIHVTLKGSTRAIDQLLQAGVAPVEIDLRDGQRDSITFEPRMFTLPPEVEITIIDPPSIELEWQDVVTRQIPLQASITGKPAEGFIVKGEPEVDPREMTVRGPVGLVEVIQYVRLAAFDVSGLTEGTYRRPIAIDAPPNRVSYIGPRSATVSVAIARQVAEARFPKRTVEVVGVPNAVVTPRQVDVSIIGPPGTVRALRAEQVVPRVDLTKTEGIDLKGHGSATVRVVVDVAEAEVEVQPPTVTVKW